MTDGMADCACPSGLVCGGRFHSWGPVVTDAERALQNLRHGSDGVLEALWRELPSPYDLDAEDREGAVNLLQALVDAALADAAKQQAREEV